MLKKLKNKIKNKLIFILSISKLLRKVLLAFASTCLVASSFIAKALALTLRDIPRVSIQTYTQGVIMPIYLTPGRASLIDFPCQVTKASQGTGGDLHATIASTIGNEVDIALDSSASQSTSLIIRCKDSVFIFDIIPSKNTHQEYIKIKKSLGSIKYYHNQSRLNSSNAKARVNSNELNSFTLIQKGQIGFKSDIKVDSIKDSVDSNSSKSANKITKTKNLYTTDRDHYDLSKLKKITSSKVLNSKSLQAYSGAKNGSE